MRIIAACTLAWIGCYLAAIPVRADQLKMECRVADWNGEYLGSYGFSFDTASGSLAIDMESNQPPQMFGYNVSKWSLLFARGGHAVFYGIVADDIVGPVHVFSLNFEKPNMTTYWLGGAFEDAPQYKANCHRLN